jgi:hypothetical protein
MIAVEKFGSNFMGALNYNLKKLYDPDKDRRAELLASSFASLSPVMIKKEVELIKSLRPTLKKHVWHTSLNFSIEENPGNLTNEKLLEIGTSYMRSMGYDDNQHLIVRHHDAEHPHIHLLVNRIRYDGSVVSDSNNFRRSQTALRRLEQQYNLIPIDQYNDSAVISNDQYNAIAEDSDISITAELNNYKSIEQPNDRSMGQYNNLTGEQYDYKSVDQRNYITKRALTKNEIEKTLRTGIPSDKSLLQALLEPIIYDSRLTLQEFITVCNQAGISLLFNQASTGKVSGITYFINDFKIKGQALGNRFKWAELIKYIDYEQDRDSQDISKANNSTKAKYGELSAETRNAGHNQNKIGGRTGTTVTNTGADAEERDSQRQVFEGYGAKISSDSSTDHGIGKAGFQTKASLEQEQDDSYMDNDIADSTDIGLQSSIAIEIADDVDDEAIHGKNRHREKKSKTNGR